MFRLKHKKLLSRGMRLLLFLVACAIIFSYDYYGYLLKPATALPVWAAPTGMVLIGGVLLAVPLMIRGQRPANRWYRAAYWAVWPFCVLPGALIILSVVILGIIGPTLGQFPVSGVLVITGMILILLGIFVVGGLAVAGYIAQGTEETRQWVRSLGRTSGELESRPTQDDTLPA